METLRLKAKRWWRRWQTRRHPEERRRILLGDPSLTTTYPDNSVRSSKYNVLTFLPLNLFEQLQRPINAYFVTVAALQFIPAVAPVSPFTTIFPLSVAFLTNTIKEALDELRRHQQDRESNSRRYSVVRPSSSVAVVEMASSDICVGDLLVLRPFEIVPCDVVVLVTSGEGGEAFVSTKSLDGETDTKERLAALRELYQRYQRACRSASASALSAPILSTLTQPESNSSEEAGAIDAAVEFICATQIELDSEPPNPMLQVYNGTLTLTAPDNMWNESHDGSPTPSQPSFSSRTLLLPKAGATNEQSPLLRGDGGFYHAVVPPLSGSRQSMGINLENVILASSKTRNTSYTIALVVFTGMETKVNMTRGTPESKGSRIDVLYNNLTLAVFCFQLLLLIVYSLLSCIRLLNDRPWYLGGRHLSIPTIEPALILPLRFFTLLSPMVPLSFKVMVELSKAYISNVIRWDEQLCDSAEGIPASVNNSALAEDLGQVQYVLSDKTGTLTTNTMAFETLATADGVVYGPPQRPEVPADASATTAVPLPALFHQDACAYHLLLTMTFCNTIEHALVSAHGHGGGGTASPNNTSLLPTMGEYGRSQPKWVSSSPDEIALVDGAAHFGMVLTERTKHHAVARVAVVGEAEPVEVAMRVMKVLRFSSERGRMSVLLRPSESKDYLLLSKGSDEKLLPLCTASLNEAAAKTTVASPSEVLSRFAGRGLRTLTYGYRVVPEAEAVTWLEEVATAEAIPSAEERQHQVAEAYAALETNLVYCGCTGVQDDLQEDVPATIETLRNADIRVWMLTGDKTETARQTAVASGLLTASDHVVTLAPKDAERLSTEAQLQYIRDRLDELLVHLPTSPRRRWWGRLWRSWKFGLRDFVREFTHPYTPDFLLPRPPATREEGTGEGCGACEGHSGAGGVEQDRRVDAESAAAAASFVPPRYSMILSGRTVALLYACGDEDLLRGFNRAILNATTVICSRTAPNQKSFFVEVVKKAGKVVLAIGDGGNDVAMIQTAHVGVGMKGKEGNQAARSADFAISQFRFLSRLLLVHGHTAYHRTAMIVQQSFWKTVLIAWVQLLYNNESDFSGVSYWDSLSLMLYNALPTVPVTFLCVMDMPISPTMLMGHPQLYRQSQRGRYLNAVTFYGYVARALLQGTAVYFISRALQVGSGGVLRSGRSADQSFQFYAAYIAVVTIHTYTVLTESHSIMFPHWHSYAFSVWICFLCFWLYARNPHANESFNVLLRNPSFYFSYIGTTAVLCVSLAVYAIVKAHWFPDLLQYHRQTSLCVRETAPLASPLRLWFTDDNPSQFWRSIFTMPKLHDVVWRLAPSEASSVTVEDSPATSVAMVTPEP